LAFEQLAMLAALHPLPLLPPSLSLSQTWRAEGIHRQVLNVKEKTKTTKARLGKVTSNHFFLAKLRNLAKRFLNFFLEAF
jgi:hypothetical protein